LDFYRNLYVGFNFNAHITGNMKDFIWSYIPAKVFSEENIMLIKCPDPDGFCGVFYHSCWEIIGTDVCKVVQQVFKQKWILPGMNSYVVSLISKIQGVDSIKDFIPIVVANFKI